MPSPNGPASPRGYILAFDFGLRRIGVAVGQATTHTASGLQTVANGREPDWAALDRLVRVWRPQHFVVGLPIGPEGEETDMSIAARRFGDALHGRYAVPVDYADERLTSREAGSRFAELRADGRLRRKHADQLDAISAQIILENWLQSAHGRDTQSLHRRR
jgi:putative holliday junction resolvase